MRKLDFIRMKEIEEEGDMNKLNVGDHFLYGRNMINQKQEKEVGDSISYFEIINSSLNSVEYTPIFDYMEKDKGEE